MCDEAITAYKKALELEPNKKVEYKQALERAERRLKQQASQKPKNANVDVLVQVLLIFSWLAMFAFGIMFLVNITANHAWLSHKNKLFVYSYGIASILSFYRNHGFPEMNRDFGLKVIMDKSVQRMLSGFLLLVAPNFLIMAALILSEFTSFLMTVIQLLRRIKFFKIAGALSSRFTDVLLDRSGNPYYKVAQTVAYLEVAAIVPMIIALFTSRRNILALVLYFQYLQVRYVIENILGQNSGVLHVTFGIVDKKITQVLAKFPPFVMTGYVFIKSFLARQVKVPDGKDQTSTPKSMFSKLSSKCSIM